MASSPQNGPVTQNLLSAVSNSTNSTNSSFNLQIPSINLKLERDTHSLWRTTIVSALETFDLESYALNPNPPPEFLPITTENPTQTLNPEFIAWKKRDRFVLLWLKSTLGPRALSIVARCTTTRAAWLALDRSFQAQTRANRMSMKAQLQSLTKGALPMLEYIEKKRSIADSLAENSHPVDDEDLIGFILQGLDSSYSHFVSAFMINADGSTVDDLVGLLLQEEARIDAEVARQAAILPPPPAPAPFLPAANVANRYHYNRNSSNSSSYSGNSNNNQGQHQSPANTNNNRGGGSQSRRRPQCQLCGRQGHEAIDCWQRENQQDFPSRRPNPRAHSRQANTAQFNSPSSLDPNWYFDSGATDHVSPDMSKLQITEAYSGNDKLQVGNGSDSASRTRG